MTNKIVPCVEIHYFNIYFFLLTHLKEGEDTLFVMSRSKGY